MPKAKPAVLTWDFVELIHELVLDLGEGLVLLANPGPHQVGGVSAGGGGGGGGSSHKGFPFTLTHDGVQLGW